MNPEEPNLRRLVEVFLEENSKINLSAFRSEEDCWNGNVLDSIASADVIESLAFSEESSMLDIGTGGGFPLLPLAILFPNWQFTGLDSTQKKCDAVQRIAENLSLKNVSLVCGRTEELGRDPDHRDQYDLVTARAVAPLNVLVEYASPFIREGGYALFWKSMNILDELQDSLLARAELSLHLEKQIPYTLPDQWGERQLLLFKKTFPTDEKYPRGVGVPKKDPLV